MITSFIKFIISGIYNLLSTLLFWILFILGFIFVLYFTFKIYFGTTWDAFVKKFESLKSHWKSILKKQKTTNTVVVEEEQHKRAFVPNLIHETGLSCKLNQNDLFNQNIYKNGKLVKNDVGVIDCGQCGLYEYKSPEGCINYAYRADDNYNTESELLCEGSDQPCICQIISSQKPSTCGI
jgi:hypothetical protein